MRGAADRRRGHSARHSRNDLPRARSRARQGQGQCGNHLSTARPTLAADLARELGERDKALAKYRERKFAEADIAFAALAAAHPAQKLYTIARCAAFCIEPPAPDWDGETKFAVK